MSEKAGLAWAGKTKPNPPPMWCQKPKPCDFDKASAYCPHRECRARLVEDFDKAINAAASYRMQYEGLLRTVANGFRPPSEGKG